jgi:hypothetical protein
VSKKRRKKRMRKPNLPVEILKTSDTAQIKEMPGFKQTSNGFNPDYSYVVKDLKRIGLLASSFIILLLILSYFLR